MTHARVWLVLSTIALCSTAGWAPALGQDFGVLQETRPADPGANQPQAAERGLVSEPRVLVAGDSWAQYMWDDGSHNDILDRYGFDDHQTLSRSLQSDPGPGHTGPEYAVSGSEARQWADTANYPWIANVITELEANPTIDTVLLSIGGNDVLAGKSDGGWYKDMDLDVPGSEAAFFEQLRDDTFVIIDAIQAARPDVDVLISSYDYPNFNVGFWCFVYACPKRRDLSRDPDNDLITDEELNGMIVTVEGLRIDWANTSELIPYDNATGAVHHYYGDGESPPGTLPLGGQLPPLYDPFPGGNPVLPTLRSNFRQPGGIDADPIHLDFEAYQYKITNEANAYFFPRYRGVVSETFVSQGGDRDGATDGTTTDDTSVILGDTGTVPYYGVLSFDTQSIPDDAVVTGASIYLMRHDANGVNPFTSGNLGSPSLDIATGSFGAPELEATDATAAADAGDVGAFIGSARNDGYAVRIDVATDGLAAINRGGLTQLRLGFPLVDPGLDTVEFRDGDGGPTGGALPALAEYVGSSAPFLDVTYEESTGILAGAAPEVGQARLRPGVPNPFAASTNVQFSLAAPAHVRLQVHDVAGRRVRTLIDRRLVAGTHNRSWDGRNDDGTSAAAGVYFVTLATDTERQSMKVVRLER